MSVRAAVGDPKRVTVSFPGVADDDVAVTVTSARAGTTSDPVSATNEGDGNYSFMLASADVAATDELLVKFSGTVDGVDYERKEQVQVAGAYYFTVSEARNLGPVGSQFTDAQIEAQRMAVEDQIESNCNTYFVSRYVEEKANGGGENFIRLTEDYVQTLIKVTQDGVDITSSVNQDGRYLWNASGWSSGFRNIVVQYEAGYDAYAPEDLRRKAIEATRYNLLRELHKGVPTPIAQMTTPEGVMKMIVAGLRQPFGYPEVDAVVLAWARRVGVPVSGV